MLALRSRACLRRTNERPNEQQQQLSKKGIQKLFGAKQSNLIDNP